MIHGFMECVREDASVLTHWINGETDKINVGPGEKPLHRVQLAAFRMLSTVAMAFSGLWILQIITFVVTFPIIVVCKLTLAITLYATAHDVFIMSQNTTLPDFTPRKVKPTLFGFFGGYEVSEESMAKKFSHGTFIQPFWMWLYVAHKKITKEDYV